MSIVTKIAKDANLIDRQVWCRTCGSTTKVHNGLRDGWPKCCSYTMTIDHPSTWKPAKSA
jgi:hypothetical protein